MDPERLAIQQISDAFHEARKRVQSLENTLDHERRISEGAIDEARRAAVAISVKLKTEIGALQQQIAALQDEAAKKEAYQASLSSVGASEWREKLTTALEKYTKTESIKSHCVDLECSLRSKEEENRLLKRELKEMTEAAAAAKELQLEAEESEARLSDEFDDQKRAHRELKHAYSELREAQAEVNATAAAHERLALDAAQEKADAVVALHKLQSRYEALKAKKLGKNVHMDSAALQTQIESLTAEVTQLAGDLARAKKAVGNTALRELRD
ncbi:hypothetical protein FB451DRAFT_1272356 [Mycena latifolia]|nr:hypothetical protein FB451DRAFT_1272356 [Mycena latifolia]